MPHLAPRRLLALLVLAFEVVAAVYLALLAWLFTAWMVDDSAAVRWVQSDWYLEGGKRLLVVLIVSAVFGGICYLVNRRWAMMAVTRVRNSAGWFSLALSGAIAISGLAGSVHFVIEKPYM